LPNASNQLVSTVDPSSGVQRTLSYSPGGDLAQDVHAGGVTYGYGYSAAKRLVAVNQNGSSAGAYAYDFQGQRVWRQTSGGGAAQTAYVYDEDGHLLAEQNAATGAVNREYVWIDDMPVALLDISGSTVTTNYIHTGQIDEPLAVTNSSQALVWNAYVDPYGTANFIATPTAALDMRLPGQSVQLETNNLSQNHWRDYDPSLGRYVEADPLGVSAGQNVYAYADGNPLSATDPRGLATLTITIDNTPPQTFWIPDWVCNFVSCSTQSVPISSPISPTAARNCPNPSQPYCPEGLQQSLQNVVNYSCKPYPPQCRPGDSCGSMETRLIQFQSCAAARAAINNQCFGGGDRGHQMAYTRARQDQAICQGLLP
jgi:RHS repeat-associated protein